MRTTNATSTRRRARRLIAGVMALALLSASCGGDSGGADQPTTTASQGGGATTVAPSAPAVATVDTLRIGVANLQEQFVDPHFAVGGLLFPMRWAISEGLYRQTLELEWIPNLAISHTLSDDGLTWTFILRQDVKMHDGSTFSARDVKTAVDRVLGSDEFAHEAVFRANVTGAEVIDDFTVAVTSKSPFAQMLAALPVPIPTDYYNSVGEEGFRQNPKAAGAWMFVEQELNASITYERFEDFFDESRKPNFTRLVYEIIPDESTRLAAVRTGAIDMAFGLTALSAEQVEREPNLRLIQSEGTGQGWIFPLDQLTPEEPSPLLDARVRKALLMAIDREGIIASLYRNYGSVPRSNTPPTMLGYTPNLDVPFDPEGAKALLAEAGHSDLQVVLNSYNSTPTVPDVVKLVETIAAFWTEIGVTVDLNVADNAAILPAWRERKLKSIGFLAGPSSFYDEPARLLSSFFLSNASYSTIASDELDAIGAQVNNALDVDERAALGRAFNDKLNEEMIALPIVLLNSLIAVGPNVADFVPMKGSPYPGPVWSLKAK